MLLGRVVGTVVSTNKEQELNGLKLLLVRGADLAWSDLSGADLSGSLLNWSDLYWANLTGTKLDGAHLAGTNFYGAKGVTQRDFERGVESTKASVRFVD